MKLNRDQIIQALEFCGICECNNEKTNTECALINMPFCKNYLRQQSLALIKELTEESHKWQEAYDCADSACRELSSKCDELTEENEKLRYNHEKLTEERDTFREYAYNMQKYVENIRHKEEEGYEPSATRYAAEMDMWRVVALEKKRLTEENERLNERLDREAKCQYDLATKIVNLRDDVKYIKEETVRKMHEKIRAKSEYGTINMSPWQLDQIAKEVLEENNV